MNIKISNIITQVIIYLALVMQSCRDESDLVVPYIDNGEFDFTEAHLSLEGQFNAIWAGMNSNYPIWDYEEKHGLNWDDVYDKYIQSFRELDNIYDVHNPVPDSIVVSLYQEMFEPLHDGHLTLYIKNIHTQKRIWNSIMPSYDAVRNNTSRQMELNYLERYFEPSLEYYIKNEDIEEWSEEDNYIYGKFRDGIVFFGLPEFNLTDIFEEKEGFESFEKIYQIWECWFKSIQELHQKNSLKGVIIDLRNNLGGDALDFQYVLGALLEGNYSSDEKKYQHIGYQRQKSGIARLDYSSLFKSCLEIYKYAHVYVEAPIVVLVNDFSASMSEITCLATKQLANGYVIGTQTFGAFSPSSRNDEQMSFVGSVGDLELNTAPFYIHIPDAAFLTLDKEIIEGYGVEPNETICLDWSSHKTTGKDNQLDRALEYIRARL